MQGAHNCITLVPGTVAMSVLTNPEYHRSALITIDVQNDFTLGEAPLRVPGTLEAVPNIVRLLEAARQKNLPVIHVVRLYLPDGSNADLCRREAVSKGMQALRPGTDGAELVAALRPDVRTRLDHGRLLAGEFQQLAQNEYAVYKSRWGAFYRTGLEDFLHQRAVSTLIFCGCNFPNCGRTSIYEASERDFRLVVATDAMSRIYARGEDELAAIGVSLLTTAELEEQLA